MTCIECKEPIVGRPFNCEDWLGCWCSEACQLTFDQRRRPDMADSGDDPDDED